MSLTESLSRIDDLQEQTNSLPPLSEAEITSLRAYYKVKLTYSSNALEGNALTESETKVVLEDGLTIGGRSLRDHLEAVGHAAAFDYVCSLQRGTGFSEQDILTLHRLFFCKIQEEQAGVYRKSRIFVTGSTHKFPSPEEIPTLMEEFVEQAPRWKEQYHPVEYAARLHQRLVAIHSFVDGNGRVARLLMNLALLQSGHLVTVIPPVLRSEYIETLETSHRYMTPCILFICRCQIESQKEYLRLLKD